MKVKTALPLSFITTLLLCCTYILHAQTPAIEWQKCYGSTNGDYPAKIRTTSDGGYIVVGYTEGDNRDVAGYHGSTPMNDGWIIKMDSKGNMQWQRCLGGDYFDQGSDVRQTQDGGYVVLCTSASINCDITGNNGALDVWLVKLNTKGDIEWQKHAGSSKNDYGLSLDLTKDGGYIAAGQTQTKDKDVSAYYGGESDAWVVKFNAAGDVQWEKSLGGSNSDGAYSVKATNDGGYIVVGYTSSTDGLITGYHGGYTDALVVKLSGTGIIEWKKSFGGSNTDNAWCVQQAPDGGYILVGTTNSNDGDVSGVHNSAGAFSDTWLMKLSATGTLEWQHCYGGKYNETGYYVQNTKDGGYVVSGHAQSDDGDLTCNSTTQGTFDTWVFKVDKSGKLLWQKSIGGTSYDEAYCVEPTDDGGFILASETCSSQIAGYHPLLGGYGSCSDFLITKLSAPAMQYPAPSVKIDVATAQLCAGSATLKADVSYAGAKYTLQWLRNGAVAGSGYTYAATGLKVNDVITCELTSAGQCEDMAATKVSDKITITGSKTEIDPDIKITCDNSVVCDCSPVTFKATVANKGVNPIYQWFVNDVYTNERESAFTTGNLRAGDVVKCRFADSSACIVDQESNTIQMQGGTSAQVSVTIKQNEEKICKNSTVIFIAQPVNGGAVPSFQWQLNGKVVGINDDSLTLSSLNEGDFITCSVTVDALNKCSLTGTATSAPLTIHLAEAADPSVKINVSESPVCENKTVTFTANALNAGASCKYQWYKNGIGTGSNAATFVTNDLKNNDVVSCDISVASDFGCSTVHNATSNNIVMIVHAKTNPSITISASTDKICIGSEITFQASVQDAGTSSSYQWWVNGAQVGNNSLQYKTVGLSNNDIVSCTLTPKDDICQLASVTSNGVEIKVYDLPVISISPKDTVVRPRSTITLNVATSQVLKSFQWSPEDKLQNAASLSPKTSPLTATTTYSITGVSEMGCQATETAIVQIYMDIVMPNSFTPNNDGINDVFRIPPVAAAFDLTEFVVYNRWGNKIFSTNDVTKGWDGTVSGQASPAGVYVFRIKGTGLKGAVDVNGTVTLIR